MRCSRTAEIEIVINLTVPMAHGAGEPADHRCRQARLLGKAARRAVQRGAGADAGRGGPGRPRRLRARHLLGRCPPGLPPRDRRRADRPRRSPARRASSSHGMEHWHPNPEFFFKRGGGPILDIGPYYMTQLVNLLGPVVRVTAQASTASPTRTMTSEPRRGQVIEVEVLTTVNGVLPSPAAPTCRSARRGTSGSTGACRSKSTAPRAACWCPTRTSSAAR